MIGQSKTFVPSVEPSVQLKGKTQPPFLCQIKSELVLVKRNVEARKLERIVRPTNRLNLGVDATSLFQRDNDRPSDSRFAVALSRIRSVNLFNVGLRHSVQVSTLSLDHAWKKCSFFPKHVISEKTRASLTSAVSLRPTLGGNAGKGRMNIVGSVRHLYSPQLNFEVSTRVS